MDSSLNSSDRSKVHEFLRKHRIGLLTLLFTDIVGSTKLKQTLGDAEAVMHIKRHHQLLRDLLGEFVEAEEISTAGDSFFVVFARPSDALRFALLLQSRLRALARESGVPVLDRVGIHVGEVIIDDNHFGEGVKDLYGIQVDNCARVMSLADGDQILMTRVVFDNARQVLRRQEFKGLGELSWLNHGAYAMKGIEDPVEVCEVGEMQKAVLAPPGDSEKARRHSTAGGELVPGWRPALDQLVPNTKWILEEKLGEGGFGEVWLGRHGTLKEKRVFKFCFRADRVRSLTREVTLFRVMKERLGGHPNIAGIQDVYFDEPPFYVVMEYAPGKDLKSWCESRGGIGKVSMRTRLEIVAQVADALNAAHGAGVIHRDIKPGNILVNVDGQGSGKGIVVKLTDFGIGQVVSEEALAGVTRAGFTETVASTGSSSHMGTHLYMAPELSVGHRASAPSDIYSLGVVLYQLLVGDWSRPLTVDWQNEIGDKLLRKILARCFAGNPAERYKSCGELSEDIRSLERRWAVEARIKSGINAALTVMLGLILHATPLGNPLLDRSYGLVFSLFPSPIPGEAVVVGMDEDSYQNLQQPFNSVWDRSIHARLLDRLKADKAAAAVFNIEFSGPKPDSPVGDEAFARSIKSFGRVVLGAQLARDNRISLPLEKFAGAGFGVGYLGLDADRDKTVRKLSGIPAAIPSLADAAFEAVRPELKNPKARFGETRWLNYYGASEAVPYVSYFKALSNNVVPPGFFRGKTVFIGHPLLTRIVWARNAIYLSPSPFGKIAFISDVEIQATAFLNLLHDDWLARFPLLEIGACVILGCLLGFGFAYSRTRICLLLALLWVAGVFAVLRMSHSRLVFFAWLIPVVQIGFSLGLTLFTSRFGELCFEKRADGTLVGYVFRFTRPLKARGSGSVNCSDLNHPQ